MNRKTEIPHFQSPDSAAEAAVVHILAQKPAVDVPLRFAAQVTKLAFTQPEPSRSPWIGWGAKLTLGSAALLTGGMFILAPHAAPTVGNVSFYGELVLLGELSGLLLFSRHLLSRD